MKSVEKEFYNELVIEGKFEPQQLQIIAQDLEYGLSKEEVSVYAKKQYSISQMKYISHCFREDIDKRILALIIENPYSAEQMEQIILGIKSALTYEQIENYADVYKTAREMQGIRKNFEKEVRENKEQQENKIIKEKQKELTELYENLSEKDKTIGMMAQKNQEKQKEIEILKGKIDTYKEKVTALEKQIVTCDKKLQELQNIGKLHQERISEMKEKLYAHEHKIQRIKEKQEKKEHNVHIELEEGNEEKGKIVIAEEQIQKAENSLLQTNNDQNISSSNTLYIQKDNMSVVVDVEKQTSKKTNIFNYFAQLLKKSKGKHVNMVKFVAGKSLDVEQLEQICIGIAKGLTDQQLMEIVNYKNSAKQMKVMIEIAVLQNKMWV